MKIRLEYVAQMKDAAGVPGELLELADAATVPDLLRAVAKAHGDRLAGLLLDPAGAPRATVLVFVGDDQVDADAPQPLRDGAVVTLMSPLAGG
jgi:molybdopterin converting factor small subunit